ncbi:hypothetical protein V8C37DRAFT_217205 [Trichoderma ceciliae]
MAPTAKTERRQKDVGDSDELGGSETGVHDATCTKKRLRFRFRKRSLELDISLQRFSTGHRSGASARSTTSREHNNDEQFGDGPAHIRESGSGSVSAEGPLRRDLSELLGQDGDGDVNQGHSDLYSPLSHPLPLPSLPSNPLAAVLPHPKAESSTPPIAAPSASSPPLPPAIYIPLPAPVTDGISENFGSPTPSTARPPRITLSAALPKSTSSGGDSDSDGDGDSDDDDDEDDEDDDDDDLPSSTGKPSTFSTSTRSILSPTPAISTPYGTQSTEKAEGSSTISRTKDTADSLTTPIISPDQTARTKTRAEMTTMTSDPSSSGTVAIAQGQEAARTSQLSPGGEKAVIASASIGGFLILLALAWLLWRTSKHKTAGRKSVWPASFPSRDIFDGPRRVSSKVSDKFTSIRGRLLPGTIGWCNIEDSQDSKHDNVLDNEKPAPTLAATAGGLLESKLGVKTLPQRVVVNSYGMVFRTPMNGDSMLDILEPPRLTPPPTSSAVAKQPVLSSKQMAAVSLENARASVGVSEYNTTLQTLTPWHVNTRISDVSSLSSGFGDGDIVINHSHSAAIVVRPTQLDIIKSNINLDTVRSSPEKKKL